ncbi:succinate dehydrogenase [Paralimibaculum aggregatum]|uniref:Succinate dehydrogenase n=1 Tax=Paralimibaculum aggregatum TaxID=3036245 RepID=A0ABQ6LR84_9RHOB|nr:succinate dehydrogenase [Limibaculum sp. NKW23]GMG84847.1 succinate dehydrogenase [Limibaculum sp. NKW23]
MGEMRLYMAQRLSALVMAPLVLGHVAVMIYAVQGGLSAAEILGRTAGSVGWVLFYGLFALAVAVHAAIGLRTILREWAGLGGLVLNAAALAIFALLLAMGWRAVWAVTFSAGAAAAAAGGGA